MEKIKKVFISIFSILLIGIVVFGIIRIFMPASSKSSEIDLSGYVAKSEFDEAQAKALYNLGLYDTFESNGDGTVTVTRQTGYLYVNKCSGVDSTYFLRFDHLSVAEPESSLALVATDFGAALTAEWDGTSGFYFAIGPNSIRLTLKANAYPVKTQSDWSSYFAEHPVFIQYKLATAYTEKLIENQPINAFDTRG